MYTYGLTDEDAYGRTSLESLYQKGKISEIDYKSVTMSSSSILLEPCYWNQFPRIKTSTKEPIIPTNYTPKGCIREGGKIVNLTKRRDENIKLAKKKVRGPYYTVRGADGTINLVRRGS